MLQMAASTPKIEKQCGYGTAAQERKPKWLRRPMAFQGRQWHIQASLDAAGLHTVCSEARCPNRSECYARGTATFLVMGPVCTRRCRFCSVKQGTAGDVDINEIERVVRAACSMHLCHVVVTSVTRDDLPDGGAFFFSGLVYALRRELPHSTIELLIPDMQGNEKALARVFDCRPDVLNHNIETVPSRYREIRPQADYRRSLTVLQRAADSGLVTKSGLMVGLGEQEDEVYGVLDDLHACGCSIVTIGQYLQPSPFQVPVGSYISPSQFNKFSDYGEGKGIRRVVAGPFVRSSYHASEVLRDVRHTS